MAHRSGEPFLGPCRGRVPCQRNRLDNHLPERNSEHALTRRRFRPRRPPRSCSREAAATAAPTAGRRPSSATGQGHRRTPGTATARPAVRRRPPRMDRSASTPRRPWTSSSTPAGTTPTSASWTTSSGPACERCGMGGPAVREGRPGHPGAARPRAGHGPGHPRQRHSRPWAWPGCEERGEVSVADPRARGVPEFGYVNRALRAAGAQAVASVSVRCNACFASAVPTWTTWTWPGCEPPSRTRPAVGASRRQMSAVTDPHQEQESELFAYPRAEGRRQWAGRPEEHGFVPDRPRTGSAPRRPPRGASSRRRPGEDLHRGGAPARIFIEAALRRGTSSGRLRGVTPVRRCLGPVSRSGSHHSAIGTAWPVTRIRASCGDTSTLSSLGRPMSSP